MNMLFEVVFAVPIGLIFIYLGLRIWKNQQISLIHEYHYKKVSDDDKAPYTAAMGKNLILMGAGIIAAGVIDYFTKTGYGWAAFALCFVVGFVGMMKAQKKYNGGLF
ncbi:MAG: DUF3784 domain-containing protein [Oscillospiraceae bacterium]